MEYRYRPTGVCSSEIILEIDQGIVKNLKVIGGCNGNLQGIAALVKGMPINEVTEKLQGIKCGYKPTSCPDQISKAIEAYMQSQAL